MQNNSSATVHTPKELLNDLHALVAEAETMLGDSFAAHSEEAVSALRSRYDAAHARFSEYCTDAKNKVVAGARCADLSVRTHPYRTMAIVAGVSLIAGILLGRRTA